MSETQRTNPTTEADFFDDLRNDSKYSVHRQAEQEEVEAGFDYLGFCERQVFPGFTSIPDEYLANNPRNGFFSEVTREHGLTHLPILNDKVRQRLALAIAKCIEVREEFAIILSDTDQLKHLNDIAGRPMGDLGIRANAAEMIRQLIKVGLGDDIYVFAAGESPDEVLVFVRNLTPEKIEGLRKAVDSRNKTNHIVSNIPVEKTDGERVTQTGTFSGSAGIAMSTDELIAPEINRFRTVIETERSSGRAASPAYTVFDTARVQAVEIAHMVKERRDRSSFPNLDFFLELDPIESSSLLIGGNGGKRISLDQLGALFALERYRGHSDAGKMTLEERALEIARLEATIKDFVQG